MPKRQSPTTTAALAEHLNPENPRRLPSDRRDKLKKSLNLGDLGGIVLNVRTGNIVGGNQRTTIFASDESARVVIDEKFERPTKAGTVAVGHVLVKGERFSYREVDWDVKRERLAMIAANAQGGEFDKPALATILSELQDAGADLVATGLEDSDVEKLLKSLQGPNIHLNESELGQSRHRCPACAFEWDGKCRPASVDE